MRCNKIKRKVFAMLCAMKMYGEANVWIHNFELSARWRDEKEN
jgi:hypothetical protein